MIKLKKILEQKTTIKEKDMDYQKLIPIQVSNIVMSLSKLKGANAVGKTNAVKKYYMDSWKNFLSLKKSIDELDKK